jgi:hypothetical protein
MFQGGKEMKKLLLLLLLLPGAGLGQTTTVTGAAVPDSAAQVAVFAQHCSYAPAKQLTAAQQAAVTEALHAKIGLSAADHAIYDTVMQAAFAGTQPLATVYATLSTQLSPAGLALLNNFIQSEKAHMQYHTQVATPDPQ